MSILALLSSPRGAYAQRSQAAPRSEVGAKKRSHKGLTILARKARCRASSSGDGECGRGSRTGRSIASAQACCSSHRPASRRPAQGRSAVRRSARYRPGRAAGRRASAPCLTRWERSTPKRVHSASRLCLAPGWRAGKDQRVDHPAHADRRRPAAALELMVEEAEVEAGIMRDQRRNRR